MSPLVRQALAALAYYAALVVLMRLAGKRLAGQTTTFDLIVVISLAVVLQSVALAKGTAPAIVFVATVFLAHKGLAAACARWAPLRRLVRGAPRALVRHGRVLDHALVDEGLSRDELLAGLRKLGIPAVEEVELAALEETGHISAVRRESGGRPAIEPGREAPDRVVT